LAPAIHNFISESLGLPYHFGLADTPDIASFVDQFRSPEWVGAVVTLPHKCTVIPLLDIADQHVQALRACNGIWKKPDGSLVGTNTDWRGIYGSLLSASEEGMHKPAMIVSKLMSALRAGSQY
jgi:quinate dehydrogenase